MTTSDMTTQDRPAEPTEPVRRRGDTLASFAPWIAYWILAGNVGLWLALLVAGAIAALNVLYGMRGGRTPKILDAGSALVFASLFVIALVADAALLQRWMQPLVNGALCAIALVSLLIGRPFVLQYAREEAPPEIWGEPLFLRTVNVITWVWIAAFALMTASSLVPPLVDDAANLHDEGHAVGALFYWVVPAVALTGAMLFTRWYPDRVQRRASAA
jgi:hypothetical protein